MKLSRNNLNEWVGLYLNDLEDFGENQDRLLTESVLNNISKLITESKQDMVTIIQESINKGSKDNKEILKDFLLYVKTSQDI